MRVIKFYFLRIQPIRFVIQAKSDLDECKNWYLNNKEQVLFMEEELLSNDKIVRKTTLMPYRILEWLEMLKAP